MKKFILRFFIILFLFLLLLFAFLITPYGFKTALYVTKKVVPGTLNYKSIDGTLTGPVTLHQLDYESPRISIHIDRMRLNWDPVTLAWKTLSVRHLNAHGIHIVLHKSAATPKPTTKPTPTPKTNKPQKVNYGDKIQQYLNHFSVPFDLHINNAKLTNISIKTPKAKQPIHVHYLLIQGDVNRHAINMTMQTHLTKPEPLFAQFSIAGDYTNYNLLLFIKGHHFQWNLNGFGDKKHIELNTSESHILGGAINGHLNANWQSALQWQFNFSGKHLDLRYFNDHLPKTISFDITSQGHLTHNQPQGNATLALNTDHATINLQANYTNQLEAKWQIDISELNSLWSDAKGALKSSGKFSGTPQQPISTGNITASDLHFSEYQFNSIKGDWAINFSHPTVSPTNPSHVNLALKGITINNSSIKQILINATGTLQKHKIVAELTNAVADIKTHLNGTLHNNEWHLSASDFKITSALAGNWESHKGFNIVMKSGDIHLEQSCLRSQYNQVLCVNFTHTPTQWQFHAHGTNIQAEDYVVYIQKNLQLHGLTELNVTATGNQQGFQAMNANVHFFKGRLRYKIRNKAVTRVYLSAEAKARYDETGLHTSIQFTLPRKDHINVNFSVLKKTGIPMFTEHSPVLGNADIQLHDLKIIPDIIPDVNIPKGQIDAHVVLTGELKHPLTQGSFKLTNGQVHVPIIGATFTQVAVNVNAHGTILHFTLKTLASGNPIHAEGFVDFSKKDTHTRIKITGDKAQIINLPEYKIYASPNLQLDMVNKKLSVKGELTIPAATIKPHDISSEVSLPTREIEFIGQNPLHQEESWQYMFDITVIIKPKVNLQAFGLNAYAEGNLHLFNTKNETILASGKVSIVKGAFRAYGHDLTIAKGSSIQYVHSPISNPIMNVRAYKTISQLGGITPGAFAFDDLKVGVNVSGTIKHMRIALYSQPAMLSQADILSYLLLGYASGSGSTSGFSIMLEAANSVQAQDGGVSNAFPDQIQQGLGLSEFGMQNSTVYDAVGNPLDSENAFVIGKRISRKLYFRYIYNFGAFQPGSIFEIRYFLGNKWAIQSTTSDLGTGMDMMYTTESNK